MVIAALLIIIAFFVFLFYFLYLYDFASGGEDFATSKIVIQAMIPVIRQHNGGQGIFFDLGSARGGLTLSISSVFPKLQVYGIDNSWVRVFFSKLRSLFVSHPPIFLQGELFKSDVSKADFIFIYLPRPLLPALEKKFQTELKKGAMVITNTVFFPSWQPTQAFITHPEKPEFEKLFTYIQT